MKLLKTFIATLGAVALLTGAALADDNAAAKKKLTCCEKAIAAGKECADKCCIAAHKAGKSCEKCNPNKEDLKAAKKAEKKQ